MTASSRTWFKSIASVFRSSGEDEGATNVQFARICVLYEDIRLEFAGAEAETIPELDRIGRDPRRFYFVRRTLASLTEFERAIHQLQMNKEFKRLKKRMPAERLKVWNAAVKKFASKHEFLADWRNDVGGHFLDGAAKYAVDNIYDTTIGTLEIHRAGTGAQVKMAFAYELVAVAMTKNKKQQTEKEFLEEAFTFLHEAVEAAFNVTVIVVQDWLLDRFK